VAIWLPLPLTRRNTPSPKAAKVLRIAYLVAFAADPKKHARTKGSKKYSELPIWLPLPLTRRNTPSPKAAKIAQIMKSVAFCD